MTDSERWLETGIITRLSFSLTVIIFGVELGHNRLRVNPKRLSSYLLSSSSKGFTVDSPVMSSLLFVFFLLSPVSFSSLWLVSCFGLLCFVVCALLFSASLVCFLPLTLEHGHFRTRMIWFDMLELLLWSHILICDMFGLWYFDLTASIFNLMDDCLVCFDHGTRMIIALWYVFFTWNLWYLCWNLPETKSETFDLHPKIVFHFAKSEFFFFDKSFYLRFIWYHFIWYFGDHNVHVCKFAGWPCLASFICISSANLI